MEHKIREAMNVLDPALVQEASVPVARKTRKLRPLLIAACLAVLCAISVAAKVYTGWTIGEAKRFDAMTELAERGWSVEEAPDSVWERDGKYELWPQAEHEAYPFDDEMKEWFPREPGNENVYFDSIAELNGEWELDILDSPLLRKEPGEQLRVRRCYRDISADKFYLLATQNMIVEGYEKLYCSVAFYMWGYRGTDIAFGTSSERNDYTFSQMEIENLQVTAECIEQKEQGINVVEVFFTKDAVNYIYMFSSKENFDMAAVTAVLESLE